MDWHFCKLLPCTTPLTPPPISPSPSHTHPPTLCSPDSHTHLIVSLGSYKTCSRSQFSERRGLPSSLSLLLTRKALSKNPWRSVGGGLNSRKRQWESYGEAAKGGRHGLQGKPRPPYPTADIGTSCTFFSLTIVVAFCSCRRCCFLERFFDARGVHENSFRCEIVLLADRVGNCRKEGNNISLFVSTWSQKAN